MKYRDSSCLVPSTRVHACIQCQPPISALLLSRNDSIEKSKLPVLGLIRGDRRVRSWLMDDKSIYLNFHIVYLTFITFDDFEAVILFSSTRQLNSALAILWSSYMEIHELEDRIR